jgi:hypothetical protein
VTVAVTAVRRAAVAIFAEANITNWVARSTESLATIVTVRTFSTFTVAVTDASDAITA